MDAVRYPPLRRRSSLTLLLTLTLLLLAAGPAKAAGPAWQFAEVDEDVAISGVACPAATSCFATSSDDSVWTEQNGAFGQASPDGIAGLLRGVSCSNTGFCMVIGDSGEATPWTSASGFGETDQFDSQQDDDLLSLSCAPGAADFCATIDHAGNLFTYSSGSWHHDVSLVGTSGISSEDWTGDAEISCASSSFCVAVLVKNDDDRGSVAAGNEWYLWNGTSWTEGSYHSSRVFGTDDDQGVVSVSCTSSTFCVATDSDGIAYLYGGSGSAWSRTVVDGGQAGDGSDLHVGCSGSDCLAVDDAGNWWTTPDGATWTQQPGRAQDDGDHGPVTDVSCTSASACYVSDENGWIGTYGVVPQATTPPALPASGSVGTPVTLTRGTWSNPDAALSDQWLACDARATETCTSLDGETGASYTPQSGDAGRYLAVLENATTGFSTTVAVASNFSTISRTGGDGDGGNTGGEPGSGPTGTGPTGTRPTRTGPTSAAKGPATVHETALGTSGTRATITLGCPSASGTDCTVRITLSVVEAVAHNRVVAVVAADARTRRTVTVGGGRLILAPGVTRKLSVPLDATGRKLLRRFHRMAVSISIVQPGRLNDHHTLHFH